MNLSNMNYYRKHQYRIYIHVLENTAYSVKKTTDTLKLKVLVAKRLASFTRSWFTHVQATSRTVLHHSQKHAKWKGNVCSFCYATNQKQCDRHVAILIRNKKFYYRIGHQKRSVCRILRPALLYNHVKIATFLSSNAKTSRLCDWRNQQLFRLCPLTPLNVQRATPVVSILDMIKFLIKLHPTDHYVLSRQTTVAFFSSQAPSLKASVRNLISLPNKRQIGAVEQVSDTRTPLPGTRPPLIPVADVRVLTNFQTTKHRRALLVTEHRNKAPRIKCIWIRPTVLYYIYAREHSLTHHKAIRRRHTTFFLMRQTCFGSAFVVRHRTKTTRMITNKNL